MNDGLVRCIMFDSMDDRVSFYDYIRKLVTAIVYCHFVCIYMFTFFLPFTTNVGVYIYRFAMKFLNDEPIKVSGADTMCKESFLIAYRIIGWIPLIE